MLRPQRSTNRAYLISIIIFAVMINLLSAGSVFPDQPIVKNYASLIQHSIDSVAEESSASDFDMPAHAVQQIGTIFPTIHEYINNRLAKHFYCSEKAFVSSAIYLDRLLEKTAGTLNLLHLNHT